MTGEVVAVTEQTVPSMHGMSAVDLVELVASAAHGIAQYQAVQAGAVGALLGTPEFTVDGPPKDLVDELAARLTLTVSAAEGMVAVSDRLTRCLPVTLGALASGRTDWPRAQVVAVETNLLTDEQSAYIDEKVADAVVGCTTGKLRARVQQEIADLDPDAVRRRARREVADRSVRYFPLPDGIGELVLRGPATELRCAFENVTSIAKDTTRPGAGVDPHAEVVDGVVAHHPADEGQPPPDRRGLDAKRFDVAVSQLTGPCPEAPGIGAGRGPQLFVLMSTALGLDEATGELVGHGAVPAPHQRRLLADHRFRRVLTDAFTGQVVAVDGHSYPPGTLPDLRRSPGAVTNGTDRTDPDQERDEEPDDGGPDDGGPDDGGPGDPPGPPDPDEGPAPARTDDQPKDAGGTALVLGARRTSLRRHGVRQDRAARRARARTGCPVAATGGGDYEIPEGSKRLVRVRSRRCMAPSCRAPATRCDTDHVVEWPQGPTCACNLVPLCRRHHGLKTRKRWHLRMTTDDPRDATVTWTTALGYRYVVAPEPVLRGDRDGPRDRDGPPRPPSATAGWGDRARRLWAAGYPTGDRAADDLVEQAPAAPPVAAPEATEPVPRWQGEPPF